MNDLKNGFGSQVRRFFTSIRLAVVLLILLCFDLCLAYLSINGRSIIFEPMNQLGLRSWLNTYGVQSGVYTAWFFILLLLLTLLAVNILTCTADRMVELVSIWRLQGGSRRLYFGLSTHIMHLSMVVILIGYLTSYTMTRVYPSLTLIPNKPLSISKRSLSLELLSLELPIYQGSRLEPFTGRVLRPQAQILLVSSKGRRIFSLSFNNPVRFQGYTIFLQRFSPKGKSSMSGTRYIVVDVRRDPGVFPYFVGIAFFVLGMSGYVLFRTGSRLSRTTL